MKTNIIIRDPDSKLYDWSEYYTVNIYCSNCGDFFPVWIKKGIGKKGLSVKCEKCECVVKL